MLVSKYDILYVTQKAVKKSTIANDLAEQAINDPQSINPRFPDK